MSTINKNKDNHSVTKKEKAIGIVVARNEL